MKMLHHPYCTKSCAALHFLEESKIVFELIDLTKNKPTKEFLLDLLQKLNISASDLVRSSEPVFIKKFQGKILSEEEWIDALVANPVLLQRPIFIEGDKAVIGRPVERIFELIPTKKG